MKFKVTKPGDYYGTWLEYGDIVEFTTEQYEGCVYNVTLEEVKENIKVKPKKVKLRNEEDVRIELIKLKMIDLQKIGHKYGVKDTKKSELVNEIIEAKKKRNEI